MTFAEAMARMEGFGVAGGRSTRNNNPGDIDWSEGRGSFAQAHGADRIEIIPRDIEEKARFAHFPTVDAGFAAMRDLLNIPAHFDAHGTLSHGYIGATIQQVITRWAPPSDNNATDAYIRNVCQWTGFPRDARLTKEML